MALELTREQKRAAATSADRAYIIAAPGSGKTTVAAERYGVIRYSHAQDTRGILAVSFARSSRGELEKRIRQRWGSSALRWPHTACTLDALCQRLVSYLLRNQEIRWFGGHRELIVLDSWRGQPGARQLDASNYHRVVRLGGRNVATEGVHISRAIFGYGNKNPHEAMLSGGICTHEEIRGVLKDALADVGLRAVVAGLMKGAVKGLIVDEVFDGNRLDLELVKVAVEAGISTTLIGDPWQALYEFRGAEPRLVPVIIDDLEFETFAISDSFRFTTALMRTLAERLRGGSPVQLNAGSAGETDVVLASHWRSLWAVSTSVLPYAFGQINNRTDAALALLLEPLATAHFGQLARAAPEAASALSLTPDVVRSELPAIAARVFARISDGSSEDAVAALALLRRELRDIGGRNIPVLAEPQEAARVANLVALSARLGRPRLIPGMTVHQAKGREWNAVGVRLQPDQLGRLAAGLAVDRAGDREIYVALTRAKESLVTL